MTESRVFLFSAVLLLFVAGACVATHQWFGVLGSLLGAINAGAARWYLLKWKPTAAVE